MEHNIVRAACALIVAFIVIQAVYFARAVFEPVAFALFAIAIVWPLQNGWSPHVGGSRVASSRFS